MKSVARRLRRSSTRTGSSIKSMSSDADITPGASPTGSAKMLLDVEAGGSEVKTTQSRVLRDLEEVVDLLNPLHKPVNYLLIFLPLAFASVYLDWGPTLVFILNFLAMIPLASLLGDFTEEAATHVGQTLGGLLNATFGNAVEVVVSIQALRSGQIRVVQSSLLGSVLSNLLLVLGCCFFFGGIRRDEQTFNVTAAKANTSLLLLSSLALILPTPMGSTGYVEEENVLFVSRITGVFMLFMYLQLLFFQLRTHKHMFEDEDEEEGGGMSLSGALVGLALMTLAVSVLSDYLVDSIDGFTEEADLSKSFVGIILLPIIGNVVEHLTAVSMAMKDKMELAMGIAVGSGTQVSVFVVPVVVVMGWALHEPMTLNFPPFEVLVYIMSIVIVTNAVGSGRSNWLFGSMLITTYVLIAVAVWFEQVPEAE